MFESVSKKNSLILARAVSVLAFFCCHLVVADVLASTLSNQDFENQLIQSIQSKKRIPAIKLIQNVFRSEKKNNPKASQFKQNLQTKAQEVAEVFFFDKAQQKYESAISMSTLDRTSMLSELEEAKKLEPDNLKIDLAISRFHIGNKDCAKAEESLIRWLEFSDVLDSVLLTKAQVDLCTGKIDGSYVQKTGVFWVNVEIERLMKNALYARAFELANLAIQLDSKFPESYYWLWKADSALKTKSDMNAIKYLSLCKGLSARQRARYQSEPNLCLRTTEVETATKKFNN